MNEDDRRIYNSWEHPPPPEVQAVIDRYMENLKAEQRRKYPELAPPEFRRKERDE
jgi:hypothetical protein